jgi:hypothetical protein
MSDVKRCKQCGLLKDIEEYRQYTYSKKNETGGRFSTCRSCESINSKYAKLKTAQSEGLKISGSCIVNDELDRIETLYNILESKGLHTPLSRLKPIEAQPKTDTETAIDKLFNFYISAPSSGPRSVVVLPTEQKVDTPSELQQWLNESPDDWIQKGLSPEFLQETIYESLKAKYRPQVGFDQEKFIPIYDDTYKAILNEILRKFDDYEESAANEGDQ